MYILNCVPSIKDDALTLKTEVNWQKVLYYVISFLNLNLLKRFV
jgi:hypothetical protein